MKVCSACKLTKDIESFSKDKSRKDGRCHACKSCVNLRSAAHYLKNAEKLRIDHRKWYRENVESVAAKGKRYRTNYPEKQSIADRKWRKANPDKASAKSKRWAIANPEKVKAMTRAWTSANIERVRENSRKYYAKHPEKCGVHRVTKQNRQPSWLTVDQIYEMRAMYVQARMLTKMSGMKWHVDHRVPLMGKLVSGLHVPWNLQVIPAIDNMKKGNKHECNH